MKKDKLTNIHQKEIENIKEEHKKELNNQEINFGNEIEKLKKQLEQQIEINKIVNKVENSSKQIE